MHSLGPWDACPSVVASSRSPQPGVHLLVVVDELDMATAPQLGAAAREVLRSSPRMLAVDLAGVRYLASAGLDALLHAHEGAQEVGCRFVLVAVPRIVFRVIEMVGLTTLFSVHDTLAAALDAFEASGARR